MRRVLETGLFALSLLATPPTRAQESVALQETKSQESIFSGTVTACSAESVTVVRRILGYPTVTRSFRLTDDTKVEGQLRSNVRVTIRYRAFGNGDFAALRIIVR